MRKNPRTCRESIDILQGGCNCKISRVGELERDRERLKARVEELERDIKCVQHENENLVDRNNELEKENAKLKKIDSLAAKLIEMKIPIEQWPVMLCRPEE